LGRFWVERARVRDGKQFIMGINIFAKEKALACSAVQGGLALLYYQPPHNMST